MIVGQNKKLILENGQVYYGYGFGSDNEKICEIVFNTSMVGYQEIISDPSYTDQGVIMTYPLIGNYGMAKDDYETKRPSISALIVREYNDEPSNFRCSATLDEIMKKYDIVGIYGLDTRKLTRAIRDYGTMIGLVTDISTPLEIAMEKISKYKLPVDVVSRVSCTEIEEYTPKDANIHIVAIDCGIKMNIIRSLNERKCKVTRVPWNTTPETILSLNPDGIFISNGPGDPVNVQETIKTVKALKGKCPIFGICLGHQIIALSYGAKTYKLKFGHRGGNHPVRNLETNKIEITSQNHSYAIDRDSLKSTGLIETHINILDQTVEGIESTKDRIFSVQYHPESAPGPQDSSYLFDKFIDMIKEEKVHA